LLERSQSAPIEHGLAALNDYLVESAPDHGLFRGAIDRARTRSVPGFVLAEVDHFFRDDRTAMQTFMRDIARSPAHRRPSVTSRVQWKWISVTPISAWDSLTPRSSCLDAGATAVVLHPRASSRPSR
jgi:hypothetical protein